MKNKEYWPRSVISGYSIVTVMVVTIAVCGYLAYGTYLATTNTILDANQFFGSLAWPAQALAGIMILHIVSAFPVVINPVFLAIERLFESKNFGTLYQLFLRVIIRTVVLAILIVLGIFFPYFLDVMTLISCISVSLSGYILPCLFYWRINSPHIGEQIILLAVILFGVAGSGIGLYVGTKQMITDVSHNPNPFKGLFSFDFSKHNQTATNGTCLSNLTYYY